jgi:transposase-like protein
MSQQNTTVAERHHFVDLKLQGHPLREIAEQTGWSFYCVRYWWRQYRDGGREALDPPDKRKQRGGPMSTFAAFCTQLDAFFAQLDQHRAALTTLLTENFELIPSSWQALPPA